MPLVISHYKNVQMASSLIKYRKAQLLYLVYMTWVNECALHDRISLGIYHYIIDYIRYQYH